MAFRTFVDSAGVQWQAWDVVPEDAARFARERRHGADRRVATRPPPGGVERRRSEDRRMSGTVDVRRGWLAFQAGPERRRMAPIPDDWVGAADHQLEEWLRAARPVASRGD